MMMTIILTLWLLLLTFMMMNHDDDNHVDDNDHPDPMIVIVDDGVNAIGWECYNDDDDWCDVDDNDNDADDQFWNTFLEVIHAGWDHFLSAKRSGATGHSPHKTPHKTL